MNRIRAYIFTPEELKLKKNAGVAAAMPELRKCSMDNGKRIVIPVDCYERAMITVHAPHLLNRKKSPPESRKSRMETKGPALWAELHRFAITGDLLKAAAWLDNFFLRLPCGECQAHWSELVRSHPPDFSSNDAYFAWSVAAHNAVNAKLGKPMFTIEQAREKWGRE